MTHGEVERVAAAGRVRQLLAAGRAVADDAGLIEPLALSTGLSREGVRLALTRYLELGASVGEIEALVAGAATTEHVHVILSANVFTAALRAIAVAWAAAESVSVRPSSRDPVLARALVGALGDARVVLTETMDVEEVARGEIHVYGRDETVAAVRQSARPEVKVRGHGTGMGVAFVDVGTDEAHAARAVAEDVVVFDQRGCLSPRVVLVEGDVARAHRVAARLAESLAAFGCSVPRGPLDDGERREATRYLETMAFAGRIFAGDGYAVGVGEAGAALVVPPLGRHVHVLPAHGVEGARGHLAPVAPFLVAVGCDDEAKGRALVLDAARVRRSRLGWMQRPPLDGPVDLRNLA